MREIKFKGKTASGEWVFGLPHDDAPHSTTYYDEYSQRIAWLLETGGYANAPIKNGTLCQFTGLTDKAGSEIFEGDILQCVFEKVNIIDNSKIKTIEWQEEWARFQLKNTDGSFELLPVTKQEWITEFYEIIGNIHDVTRAV